MINIAILATPRTGSNYLCECLTQTGAFGHVDGFFVGTGDLLATQFEQNAQEWIATHRKGDIHACKLSLEYLDHVAQYVSLDRILAFMETFTHFILLDRVDTLAQAVSYFIADFTKRWTSTAQTDIKTPEYSFQHIAWYYALLRGLRDRVYIYSEFVRKPIMYLYYEYFADNENEHITRIAKHAGITLGEYTLKPTLQRQSMPEKDAYIKRFREELHLAR